MAPPSRTACTTKWQTLSDPLMASPPTFSALAAKARIPSPPRARSLEWRPVPRTASTYSLSSMAMAAFIRTTCSPIPPWSRPSTCQPRHFWPSPGGLQELLPALHNRRRKNSQKHPERRSLLHLSFYNNNEDGRLSLSVKGRRFSVARAALEGFVSQTSAALPRRRTASMELSRRLQCVLRWWVVTGAGFAGLVFPAWVAAQSSPLDRQVAITIDD